MNSPSPASDQLQTHVGGLVFGEAGSVGGIFGFLMHVAVADKSFCHTLTT